jgi:hypothetical protein
MEIKGHEKTLMEVVVLRKSRPAALEELLTGAIVPHLHFVWSSSTRVFTKNRFPQFSTIHELGEFRWQTLNFAALRVGDAKERIDSGGRMRSISGRSTWTWHSRWHLGFVLAPGRTARASLYQGRR